MMSTVLMSNPQPTNTFSTGMDHNNETLQQQQQHLLLFTHDDNYQLNNVYNTNNINNNNSTNKLNTTSNTTNSSNSSNNSTNLNLTKDDSYAGSSIVSSSTEKKHDNNSTATASTSDPATTTQECESTTTSGSCDIVTNMHVEPERQLTFCQLLQAHNYTTRTSMKMLMILDLANKLIALANSPNHLIQLKDFIRNDLKEHGIALYGHVGGGQKFTREVINYVGSKRTKRKFMPLTTACIIGSKSMVKFLMKNGANQYQKCMDELPVETAQRFGHVEIVRFLRDFSLDTCHKNRKIRKHFKHDLNDHLYGCGLLTDFFNDVTISFHSNMSGDSINN